MPQGSCLLSSSRRRAGPPVNEAPRSAEAEFSEVKADGRPRREIVGHEPPWAAALQDVEDSVEDVAQGVSTQPTRHLGSRKIGFQASPFLVGEVGRIGPSHAREGIRPFQPSPLPNRLLARRRWRRGSHGGYGSSLAHVPWERASEVRCSSIRHRIDPWSKVFSYLLE